MNYKLYEEAREELEQATAHYAEESERLGQEFLTEFENAIQRIRDFPEAWGLIGKNVRLCQLTRFPYGIVYFVKDDIIRVVAVAQLHRKPGYWKVRLKHPQS